MRNLQICFLSQKTYPKCVVSQNHLSIKISIPPNISKTPFATHVFCLLVASMEVLEHHAFGTSCRNNYIIKLRNKSLTQRPRISTKVLISFYGLGHYQLIARLLCWVMHSAVVVSLTHKPDTCPSACSQINTQACHWAHVPSWHGYTLLHLAELACCLGVHLLKKTTRVLTHTSGTS